MIPVQSNQNLTGDVTSSQPVPQQTNLVQDNSVVTPVNQAVPQQAPVTPVDQTDEIPESEKVDLKDLFQTMFSFELFVKLVELSLANSIMTQEPNYEFFMTVYNALQKYLETLDDETVNEFQEQIADVIVNKVEDIRSLKDQGMTEEQYDAFVKALGFERAEPQVGTANQVQQPAQIPVMPTVQ